MIASRRGKNVAIVGGACQLVFIGTMLAVWLVTNSLSALAVVLLLAGGMGVWLVAAVLLYCRELARREAMELEELAAGGPGSDTIFEGAPEGELRPAALRLARMERWVPPIFTLLWCAYNAAIGVLMLRYLVRVEPAALEKTGVGLLFTFLVAFACFLFSRYCTGMGTQAEWRLLRTPGSFLLVNVLLAAGVAAALVVGDSWSPLDSVVAVLAMSAQMVLAIELLANLVMDFYRPRMPGREERFSYDSRLCNLLAEPQKMGHSIAETLNYQFGFEVSKTWFYRLVAKALLPLIAFGVLVLWAMSSIVIVRNGERAIVLHWGRPNDELGPGMHLKWPWPIDTARRLSTTKVHEIWLGLGETGEGGPDHEDELVNGRRVMLWTKEHAHDELEEKNFLIAYPSYEDKKRKPQVIKLVAPVRYVVVHPYKYAFRFADPAKTLECLAYREMVRYCASATLYKPVGGPAKGPEAIMTYGREAAAKELKRRIQEVVSHPDIDLGVEITYVGLTAVHPPADAAQGFQKVLEARHEVNSLRYEAEKEANRMLINAAGSPEDALLLALAVTKLEQFEALGQTLRNRPDEVQSQLDGFIKGAEDDIKILDKEIQADLLLGLGDTYRERVRTPWRAYLEKLQSIRESLKVGQGGLDFAAMAAEARKEAEKQIREVAGKPAAMLADAEATRWQVEMEERSRLDSFLKELPAYEVNPRLYMLDRRLDVLDKILPKVSKVVLGVEPGRVELRLNWQKQQGVGVGLFEPKESDEKE